MNGRDYARSLDIAAMQFKLALHVNTLTTCGTLPQKTAGMNYGKLYIYKDDLMLSEDDAAIAGSSLMHCATFMLAVAIDSALEREIPERFNSSDPDVVVAARIARILRNAFSHDPFFPTWLCTNPNHLGKFEIQDVISIDTNIVNGMEVEWQHYGGPLAILRFLRHCQSLLRSHAESV